MAEISKYKIRPGQKHYLQSPGGLVRFSEGDVLLLTSWQARAIMDKLEPVPDDTPVSPGRPAIEPEGGLVEETQREPRYKRELRKGSFGLYDIVDTLDGRVMNVKPLTLPQADAALAEYENDKSHP